PARDDLEPDHQRDSRREPRRARPQLEAPGVDRVGVGRAPRRPFGSAACITRCARMTPGRRGWGLYGESTATGTPACAITIRSPSRTRLSNCENNARASYVLY